MFYIQFFYWKNERIAHFLFFGERCEWIAHFAQIKWAICWGCSMEMSDREQIAQVAHQKWANEWIANFFEQIAQSLIFGQKMSNSLGNQMSQFPALIFGHSTFMFIFMYSTVCVNCTVNKKWKSPSSTTRKVVIHYSTNSNERKSLTNQIKTRKSLTPPIETRESATQPIKTRESPIQPIATREFSTKPIEREILKLNQ